MQVKEESEKAVLKLNIQRNKIMASGPFTSVQIDEETVIDFIFWGALKSLWTVTAAMKLKDACFLEENFMTNLLLLLLLSCFSRVRLCATP